MSCQVSKDQLGVRCGVMIQSIVFIAIRNHIQNGNMNLSMNIVLRKAKSKKCYPIPWPQIHTEHNGFNNYSGYGMIWYHPEGIANILYYHSLEVVHSDIRWNIQVMTTTNLSSEKGLYFLADRPCQVHDDANQKQLKSESHVIVWHETYTHLKSNLEPWKHSFFILF